MQVGAIRVNEQDRREAAEESESSTGASPLPTVWNLSHSGMAPAALHTGQLLDEEVFLSQLHRRAKLLNGDFCI